MTTADIVFAEPGNPDRLRDHEQDARMILWALLAAILIHLIVAFLLAAFSGFFSPSLPAPEKPVELTFMDLSPASASKNSAFIETDESKKAPEPKDKTFESNANSVGASELAAAGEMPLPSQTGKDRPLMDLETNPYSLDSKGAQAQQKPAPQQKAAQPVAQPEPITAGEQFALLTQKSAAALDAAAASQAQSAYRRQRERNQIAGNITNRGISSVNALGTPLGRYQKIVADSIGSRWYTYVDQKRDLINIGTLRLRFVIDPSGRVKDLKVTENSSNEAFASVCVQSVLEAHLPPIPEEVVNTLPPEGLEVDGLGFIIFPNG
jgi:outer membrane biosynthesis protein TonB